MSQPIVFYDINSSLPAESRAWAPNPWVIRIILAYKSVPFETTWIEYSELGYAIAALGVPPTGSHTDGSPRYTVPTIHDPNTGRTLTDSAVIAKYLDEQYPERIVLPSGTADRQTTFVQSLLPILCPAVFALIGQRIYTILPAPSRQLFDQRLRAVIGGPSLADLPPPSAQDIEGAYTAYLRIADALIAFKAELGLEDHKFLFVDAVCLGLLQWLKRAITDGQFKRLLKADGGKWQRLYDVGIDYLVVDEGEKYRAETSK